MKKYFLVSLSIFLLFSCSFDGKQNDQANTNSGSSGSVEIANPASQNCTEKGGKLEIKTGENGEYGICYFEDNRQCEEWALFKGNCPEGGVKVTGYDNDGQIYCAITGGEVDMQNSVCTRKDGTLCKINENDIDCEVNILSELDFDVNLSGKNYTVKFSLPYDWKDNYTYDYSEDTNIIMFNYVPKEEEYGNMLFSINFAKKADYQKELDANNGIALNNELIKEVDSGEYVMSYSRTLDMPFTKEQDVKNYSKMVEDIPGIIKNITIEESGNQTNDSASVGTGSSDIQTVK